MKRFNLKSATKVEPSNLKFTNPMALSPAIILKALRRLFGTEGRLPREHRPKAYTSLHRSQKKLRLLMRRSKGGART